MILAPSHGPSGSPVSSVAPSEGGAFLFSETDVLALLRALDALVWRDLSLSKLSVASLSMFFYELHAFWRCVQQTGGPRTWCSFG